MEIGLQAISETHRQLLSYILNTRKFYENIDQLWAFAFGPVAKHKNSSPELFLPQWIHGNFIIIWRQTFSMKVSSPSDHVLELQCSFPRELENNEGKLNFHERENDFPCDFLIFTRFGLSLRFHFCCSVIYFSVSKMVHKVSLRWNGYHLTNCFRVWLSRSESQFSNLEKRKNMFKSVKICPHFKSFPSRKTFWMPKAIKSSVVSLN